MFQKQHILFEDRHLLVCYKEAGFPVQTSRVGSMDLESALKAYLADGISKQTGANLRDSTPQSTPQSTPHSTLHGASQSTPQSTPHSTLHGVSQSTPHSASHSTPQDSRRVPYLGLINRLDQPVEGLVLFARTKHAAAALSRQLQDGKIGKEYLAVVRVGPETELDEGSVEHLLVDELRKEPKGNLSRIALPGETGAKQARLTWSCVSRRDGMALLRIHLLTGRHHQIRVQLAHAHMPICGDTKYGVPMPSCGDTKYGVPMPSCGDMKHSAPIPISEDTQYGAEVTQNGSWQQIALCAAELHFVHPETHKKMDFSIKPQNPIFGKVTL